MSLIELPAYGPLTGNTPVIVIAAPAASHRFVVISGSVFNEDSAPVTVTLQYRKLSGSIVTIIATVILQPADTLHIERDDVITLSPAEQLELVMSAGPATLQPTYRFTYGDVQ